MNKELDNLVKKLQKEKEKSKEVPEVDEEPKTIENQEEGDQNTLSLHNSAVFRYYLLASLEKIAESINKNNELLEKLTK